MRRINLLVLTLFLLLISTSAEAKLFNSEHFKLENGLEVVVIPNHRAPVVSHMMWYKVGGADEPKGKSGITHFLEHLMFKGTTQYPDGVYSSTVKKLGGNENAFTSDDYTAYYQNIPKEHLSQIMTMEADRMRNLTLSEENIQSERKVIIEERQQRTEESPFAQLREHLNHALYMNHPYATPVIGWMEEIKHLTREDALNSYNKWYYPNNAILIVSGDITAEELKPLVQNTYGKIKANPSLAKRIRPALAPLRAEQRLTLKDKRVGKPMIVRIRRAPRGDQALDMALHLLGGDSSSRLYTALVVEKKLAVSVGTSYDPIKLNDTSVTLYAMPTPETSLEDLEAAVIEEVQKTLKSGFTQPELNYIKEKKLSEMIYYLDSLHTPPTLFGKYMASGFGVDYIENLDKIISELTIEQVNNALRKVFVESNPTVTGILLPEEEAKQ